MRVTGYEHSGLREFASQRHHIVRKIIAARARL
jgi:hypothetical protein